LPEIRRDASALPPDTAACMGAFDGIHRGHQALIERARMRAEAVALVTFDPHPARILAPDRAPRLLQSPAQRARVAGALGVELMVLLPFDRSMASLDPDAFVRRYVVEGLRPSTLVVGEDFRFGARRAGDVTTLERLLRDSPIDLEVVAPVPLPEVGMDAKLSSSDIRRAVEAGAVERAGDMLGRWHAVLGTVTSGAKRGRKLGFPTANVATEGFLPREGIYATAIAVWDAGSPDYGRVWPSVSSVGRNPTFVDGGPVTLETYVLDEDLGERLYGLEVEVSFIARLRDQQKFDDTEGLVARMHEDVEQARPHLHPGNLAHLVAPS
jgi:riboflavin kinase / FMN adenylyltransferase